MNPPATAQAEHLHTSGLKATLPRLKVLALFQREPGRHLSADDVYRLLLEQGSDIGLATVYRVLLQFEEAGLLSRQAFEPGRTVYELAPDEHHDHLLCLHCGRVEEFHDAGIEQRQHDVAASLGFALRDHRLVLYGVCSAPLCRDKAASVPG